jgi:hypothetical protein
VGHRLKQAMATETLRDAENPEQKDQQGCEDDYQFPGEIFIHTKTPITKTKSLK